MKKAIQYFDAERLESDKDLSPTQIAQFLDDFRQMQNPVEDKSIAISLRMKESLREEFKSKCKASGITNYQKQIRLLMQEWLSHH